MLRTSSLLVVLFTFNVFATASLADGHEAAPAAQPEGAPAPAADPVYPPEPPPAPAPAKTAPAKGGDDVVVKPTAQYRIRVEGNTNKDTVDGAQANFYFSPCADWHESYPWRQTQGCAASSKMFVLGAKKEAR